MFDLIKKAQRYNCSDKLMKILENIISQYGNENTSITVRLGSDHESITIEYKKGYVIETISDNGNYHFNLTFNKQSKYVCTNYEDLDVNHINDNIIESETREQLSNARSLALGLDFTKAYNIGMDYSQNFSFTNPNSDLVLGVNNTGKVLFKMTPKGKIILSNVSKLEMLEGLYNLGVLSKEAVTCELKIELLKNDSSVAYEYNNNMSEEERIDCIYYARDICALISKINMD